MKNISRVWNYDESYYPTKCYYSTIMEKLETDNFMSIFLEKGDYFDSAVDKNKIEKKNDDDEILDRNHFREAFNTNAYLRDFYTNIEDPAMQMVICYLPNIAARFPQTESLLDFGAGPTIHVAIIFRNKVQEIYLADYLPQNRQELIRWQECRSDFNWTSTLKIIATNEGISWSGLKEIEANARRRIRGIFHCDCFAEPAIRIPKNFRNTFDIITSFYTLEYCCNTLMEYSSAIQRIVAHVRPGGHFIMGGILEENWCAFGGRKFKCLYITKDFVLDCLRNAGMELDEATINSYEKNGDFNNNNTKKPSNDNNNKHKTIIFFELNGMFMISCKKKMDVI